MDEYYDLEGGRDDSDSPPELLVDPSLRDTAPELAGAHGLAQGFATGSASARRKSRIMAWVILFPTILVIIFAAFGI